MASLRKRTSTFILLAVLVCNGFVFAESKKVTEVELDSIQSRSSDVFKEFMSETFLAQLHFDLGTLPENSEVYDKAYNQTCQYSNEMNQLLSSIGVSLSLIENYKGYDWDIVYGSTDLWEKAKRIQKRIVFLKVKIDYFKAAFSTGEIRKRYAVELLQIIDNDLKDSTLVPVEIEKARLYALLSDYDSRCRDEAIRLIEEASPKLSVNPNDIKARIVLYNLTGCSAFEIRRLYDSVILSSFYMNRLELDSRIAVLAIKYNYDETLEYIIKGDSQIRSILSRLITEHYEALVKQGLSFSISSLHKDIIAYSLLSGGDKISNELMDRILLDANTPFTRLLVADKLEEDGKLSESLLLRFEIVSSYDSPTWVSEDFSKEALAKKLTIKTINYINSKSPKEIIEVGEKVLKLYQTVDKSQFDPELEHELAYRLAEAGSGFGMETLTVISKGDGSAANAALLDSFILKYNQSLDDSEKLKNLAIDIERDMMRLLHQNDIARYNKALMLQAQIRLDIDDSISMKSVAWEMVNAPAQERPDGFETVKMELLIKAGNIDKAIIDYAAYMQNTEDFDCDAIVYSFWLVMDKYEYYKNMPIYDPAMFEALKEIMSILSEKCDDDNAEILKIIGTEFTLLETGEINSVVSIKFGSEQSPEVLRLMARISQLTGDFKEATKKWQQLVSILKEPNQEAAGQSWQWWRAKYYQLYCYSKMSDCDMNTLKHALEVLVPPVDEQKNIWHCKLQELAENQP